MKLVICGPGQCGKDTTCNWLNDNCGLLFTKSTSMFACDIVFSQIHDKYGYSTPEEAYADRSNHREEWAQIIENYNKPDGLTIYREMVKTHDLINGLRRGNELEALKHSGLIDLIVWIDRDVPEDPSLTFTRDAADIIIDNTTTIPGLYHRLQRFTDAFGISKPLDNVIDLPITIDADVVLRDLNCDLRVAIGLLSSSIAMKRNSTTIELCDVLDAKQTYQINSLLRIRNV